MKARLRQLLDRYPDLPSHAATAAWTLFLASVGLLESRNSGIERLEFARAEARAACRTDLAYTRWTAAVGGVYVPVSGTEQPVGRLASLPGRDATTTDGRALTLVNPACVIDRIHAEAHPGSHIRASILGTTPAATTNPASPADAWNARAIAELAGGKSEVFGYADEDGTNIFRYMAALPTEQGCLKCHADQGFTLGELRGAIRIDVPLDSPALSASDREQRATAVALWIAWIAGIAGIQGNRALARSRREEREAAFRDLARREERYRNVVEGSPDGFWLVDGERRILEVNDNYVRRSGYSREELLGMHIEDLEALETPERTNQRIEQLRREGSAIFDTAHRARDGSIWPTEAKVTYSPADGGRFAAFFRDLSRQNRSEMLMRLRGQLADLAQSASVDEVLRAALDHAERLSGSCIGVFHFVSPDQEKLTLQTWSTRTLAGTRSADGRGQHHPVSETGIWVECLKARKPVVHDHGPSLPHRQGLPDGHAKPARELVVPVARGNRILAVMGVGNKSTPYTDDDVDLVEAIASMVTDLALRKRAQEELARFFEIVPDLVCIADSRGNIRQLNPVWEPVLGFPIPELLGRSFPDLVHPADRRTSLRRFAEAIRGRNVHGFVNRLVTRDGSYRWLEWSAVGASAESLVFAAARDITDRRLAEQLAAHQATLGVALASGHSPDSILRLALDIVIEASGMDCGGLYLRDPESRDLSLVAHRNLSPAFIDKVCRIPANSPRARLVEQGRPTYADYSELGPGEIEQAEGLRAIAVVCIPHEGQILGCINVASRTASVIPNHSRTHLETLVPQLGSVIARIRAEAALRDSEERLRVLFEAATDAIFWADADTGIIDHCNRAAESLFGRPRGAIVGSHVSEAHAPADRPRYARLFADCIRHGELASFEGEIVRADGTHRSVLVSASTTRVGDRTIVQGIFHDITDYRESRREIERQQALLQAIFDNTPFMLCIVDEKGRIERMNRAMSALLEVTPAGRELFIGDVVGCLGAVDSPADRERSPVCLACTLRRTLLESYALASPAHRVEITLPVYREGRRGELRLTASTALVHLENRTRLLVCLEDTTATRQLERQFLQAQKMEAVGQLAGGVAHDFNNIVGATMMHLHLLLETPGLDPEMRVSLQELETETRRAANLTRQLLLFGRREVAQIRRINANEVVEGLLKMLRRLLGEHIEISFQPSQDPAWLDADPGMLEQVLMNLCVNARDAMPKGGPLRISASVREVTPELARQSADARVGSFVCLSVEDSGTGIDPETLGRIFEPFFTTKAAGKGTGLGLATVYGIVQQHHGWIDVQSTPGLGTAFHVHLPAAPAAGSLAEDSSRTSLPKGTESILLVEDDPGLLRTATLLLRLCGYRVLEARNGPDAIRLWQEAEGRIDLVFTDVVMPGGIGGIDLAETLRREKPAVRVLLASGYSPDLVSLGTRHVEGFSFLPKPYTPPALAEAVRRCLDGRS